jgi:hypothetical protein
LLLLVGFFRSSGALVARDFLLLFFLDLRLFHRDLQTQRPLQRLSTSAPLALQRFYLVPNPLPRS